MVGDNNLGDMICVMIFTTLHSGEIKIGDSNISLLTIIDETLMMDTAEKDNGAFSCFSLVLRNYSCNIGKKWTYIVHFPSAFLKLDLSV